MRWVISVCLGLLTVTTVARGSITEAELARATTIVQTLGYVPFEYLKDGCSARALYMAMELAVEQIPSQQVFVFPTDPDRPLHRPGGGFWDGYHVTPMLKVRGREFPMILDPPASAAALTLPLWKHALGDVPIRTIFREGSHYWTPEESESPEGPAIETFGDLPAFRMKEVIHACRTLWENLDRMPQQEQSASLRRAELTRRTQALITSLHTLGKLTDDLQDATFTCGGENLRIP